MNILLGITRYFFLCGLILLVIYVIGMMRKDIP
jgi:hypothetical protein